jgi:hypothetical protein
MQGDTQGGRSLSELPLHAGSAEAHRSPLLSSVDPKAADPKDLARFVDVKLVAIDDPLFGGWAQAQPKHFAEGGIFDQIYQPSRRIELTHGRKLRPRLKRPSAIPGFGLALGFTLTYLSLIVLIPLAALVLKSATLGLTGFWEVVTGPRTLAALRLSFLTSLFAATSMPCLAPSSLGRSSATAFPAAGCSTPSSIFPSRCRRPSPASLLPRSMHRMAGLGSWLAPLGIKVAYTPLWHCRRADLHRPALRGAHRAAGA